MNPSLPAPVRVSLPLLLALLAPLATGCAASPAVLPLSPSPPVEAPVTLVWVGQGEAERLEGGKWQRIPAFDYDFSVVQRRYGDHWESVKSLHRRHPAYDGSAGPRDQTMFFRLDYDAPNAEGAVNGKLHASLGEGTARTDREFRRSTLELAADVSRFAPFNTYRITQDYAYATGSLRETVELLAKKGPEETPWVRNHETAKLFGPQSFADPPSRAR